MGCCIGFEELMGRISLVTPVRRKCWDAPRASMRRLSCTSSMYLCCKLTQPAKTDVAVVALTRSQPFCPCFLPSSQRHAILSVCNVPCGRVQWVPVRRTLRWGLPICRIVLLTSSLYFGVCSEEVVYSLLRTGGRSLTKHPLTTAG